MANADPFVSCMGHKFPLKYFSLFCLVFQNVALVLSIGYSRNHVAEDGLTYLVSTAVICSEMLKLFLSFTVEFFTGPYNYNIKEYLRCVAKHVFSVEMIKLGVPGGLYVLQNNLLFVALTHLTVSVYQVTVQLKIFSTALFSYWVLKKMFSFRQIVSLVILVAGVVLVQLDKSGSPQSSNNGTIRDPLLGFVAVVSASTTSGFASVYFEKILKHETKASIMMSNVQLAIFGVLLAAGQSMIQDQKAIFENGFFQGYTRVTWFVIAVQAAGGLIVAVVMKYADNILKGFATSCSLVIASALSAMLLDNVVSLQFVVGAGFVICAVFIYSMYPYKKPLTPRNSEAVTDRWDVEDTTTSTLVSDFGVQDDETVLLDKHVNPRRANLHKSAATTEFELKSYGEKLLKV